MVPTDLKARARQVMKDAGFEPDFSTAALAEATAARPPVDPAVADLRERLWSSIDNPTSRDLDQLEWAERLSSGRARLCIAVADVDALAPAGGAIDQHAGHNTTSVYTGVATFSMIPDRLSADLTSLHEGQDRLAMVIDVVVADDGEILEAKASRALVRNRARLAYGEVAAWLDDRPRQTALAGRLDTDGPLGEQLRLQRDIATALRARRRRHGALEFETTEVRAVSDGKGISAIETTARNAARDLVEDIMLTANTAVAGLCERADVSWIRRIVRSPERWDRIVAVAREHGGSLPAMPSGPALSAFLLARRAADPATFADLSLAIVKLIGKGEYAVERRGEDLEGHFGLAVGEYTHGTAPNRRYADLVMQRLLKAALAGAAAPYSDAGLEAITKRCTDREDEARRVERQLRKIAAAAFIAPRIGDSFDAIVTGVAKKGTFARLVSPPVEGRIVRGEAGLDVGDRVRVRLVGADPERGFIDFAAEGRRA